MEKNAGIRSRSAEDEIKKLEGEVKREEQVSLSLSAFLPPPAFPPLSLSVSRSRWRSGRAAHQAQAKRAR